MKTIVCCGTCRHSRSTTGGRCKYNLDSECLGGKDGVGILEYNYWELWKKHKKDKAYLPDKLFEI